jgi:N-acetylmuramoyl-L-alanine amidase
VDNSAEALAKPGDSGQVVTEVIASLARLGLLRNSPTSFDDDVIAALAHFQQSRGLSATGVLTRGTYRALEEARWRLGDRNLSVIPGALMRGDDVTTLQQRLTEMGFDSGRIDGIYGPLTESAVKEFQRQVGLASDGIVGVGTYKALIRLVGTVKGGAPANLRDEYLVRRRGPALNGKIVVLDPSFGGSAKGCEAFGLNEAQIVFDIAQRVEGRLSALGVRVFLTRGKETNPSESERIEFANRSGADLVVSLHIEHHKNPIASGVATYYYGSDEHEIHSVVGEKLAKLVQREISARTDLINCRTHARTWELLRLTKAPTIRVDCGYLSNESDATKLARAAFRDTLAESLVVAVQRLYLAVEEDAATGTLSLADLRKAGLRK